MYTLNNVHCNSKVKGQYDFLNVFEISLFLIKNKVKTVILWKYYYNLK